MGHPEDPKDMKEPDYRTILEEQSGMKRGTGRIRSALEKLGNPENEFPIIMVGGTNGKTTTAHFISQLLARSGLKVGLFTSPNPDDPVKSTQIVKSIGSAPSMYMRISGDDLTRNLMSALETDGTQTSFELEVCSALMHFSAQSVHAAVMEMGMGGEGDAVNVRQADLAVITNVTREHTSHLGESVEEIAREKGGIIPWQGILVTMARMPALEVLQEICDERGAELIIPDHEEFTPHAFHLMAGHQKENAVLAMESALRFVYHSLPDHASRISSVNLMSWASMLDPPEGRMQVIALPDDTRLLLDGAHNPAGFKALFGEIDTLTKERGSENVVIVVGILEDKDISGMAEITGPIQGKYFCTSPSVKRGERPEVLASEFRKHHEDVFVAPNIHEGIEMGRLVLKEEGGLIVVTGSLYTVSEALTWAKERNE